MQLHAIHICVFLSCTRALSQLACQTRCTCVTSLPRYADIELATTTTSKVPVYMGRFDVPVSYEGKPSKTSWVRVNAKRGIGFTFGDYPGATKIRGCMSFTDSSSGKGQVHARLREAGGKNKVYFSDNYGETWSGSGLVHHECGAWHDLSKVTCGYSWGNDCQVDIQHTQGVALAIYEFDFEIARDAPETKPPAKGVFAPDSMESFFINTVKSSSAMKQFFVDTVKASK